MKKKVFNPYLPNFEYIPDGEPHIFENRLYVYGSHDRFNGNNFCVNDYITWSAPLDDLSDWRYEGVILGRKDDPVYKGKAYYAPDVCQAPDGKYYIYYCSAPGITAKSWNIHVAVSDKPSGPFKFHGVLDLTKWHHTYLPFDPAVLVDDGRVFLYYGSAAFYPLLDVRKNNVLGGCVVELDPNDMMTVIGEPKLTLVTIQNDKEKKLGQHAFFEASSIRKFNNKYYFVYSSQAGHELCYAIGDNPMGPFEYKGVLVSNGDIGLPGHTCPKDAVDFTGNTHGGVTEVNGHYYVFFHRQTNKCQFSRQGIAEEIFMKEDGTFDQVERTSQGLNGKPLENGNYPASIACGLRAKNGNRFYGVLRWGHSKDPYFTQEGADRNENPNQYIANFNDGCSATYKYFNLKDSSEVAFKIDGKANGKLTLKVNDNEYVEAIALSGESREIAFKIENRDEKAALKISYSGAGKINVRELIVR